MFSCYGRLEGLGSAEDLIMKILAPMMLDALFSKFLSS